jgi:crotonobetaine/carnitine-CoA ligase
MNIRKFLEYKVSQSPDKVYLVFEDQEWTYRQFDQHVNQAANAFLELRIHKGDRVCIMLNNSPEFLFSWFGLNKIGGIMVPINTSFKATEAHYIVEHCEAKGIVVSAETLDVALSLQERSSTLGWIGVFDKGSRGSLINLSRLFDQSSNLLEEIPIEDHAISSIIYTSGTTGLPKGVMHTQNSYILCGEAMILRAGLLSEDRLMVILPLFHANAQFYSTMGSLAVGASLVVIPRFSASQFWHQSKQYCVTQFNFIGAIGRILASRSMEEFEPNHFIRVANGGPIPADVYEAFTERFKIPHVIDGYGLTECPCVCQNPINGVKKVGSMGLPAIHPNTSTKFTSMKIVDEEDHELPLKKVGELVLQSPVIMKGYFKDPEETSDVMRGGWFHTGDYCYRDEDGYYFFVDRKKDVIRRKGENISSVEVEKVINAHPKVLESAVVAVPSALSEDEARAFVVLKEGEELPGEEIINWCLERLANFKIPRYLVYMTSLPKTPSQRIAKYLLRGKSTEVGLDMKDYIQKVSRKRGFLDGNRMGVFNKDPPE